MKHNIKSTGSLGSGLKDKNDKEIFEGDSLKITAGDEPRTVTVNFRDAAFFAGDDLLMNFASYELEIVG